ncbi:DUF4307 domain-containing protein [uncultured Nocardioides sp.]|uniref:DUF4307 domain-containing protein n=1 Tax=uncultured Nocardioides sp. TaxID=198441 RepID=UPI00260B9D9C|nr:DUF4307 domain-containing protein [uncultured Nocardioides sp.]
MSTSTDTSGSGSAGSVPADRYGAPRVSARRAGIVGLVVVGLLAAVWLTWVTLAHSSPEVRSQLTGWDVVDDGSVTAILTVTIDPDVVATCRVRAVAEDHTIVGELGFTVDGSDVNGTGRLERTVRTERRATAVDDLGCTTADQSRPR